MSRIRIGLGGLALAGVCALAAFAFAAGASGQNFETCVTQGTIGSTAKHKYSDGLCNTQDDAGGMFRRFVYNGAVKDTSGAAANTLSSTISGVSFKVTCTGLSGSGTVANSGGEATFSEQLIAFEGCSVTLPAGKGCSVPATIETVKLKASSPAESWKTTYTPESGEKIMTISISGCSISALNGEKSVTGSAASSTEAEAYTQEFSATTGSALKLSGQTATLVANLKVDEPNGIPLRGGQP